MSTRPRKGERRFVLRGDGKSELYMRLSPTIMVMSSRGTQWFSAAALAAHSLSSSEFGASKSRIAWKS